jgi:vancomycin resistance protein YoaR
MDPNLRRFFLFGLLPLAGGIFWWTRPAPHRLSRYSTDLELRSSSQRHNISLSAQALNQIYLQPGEIFSFNQTVGPRTQLRGYVPAPAYMSRETVNSVGGGICQVSSTLYNAALLANLTILERHAHFTSVESVPPGLDATVWYGQADLRLQNPYPWPIYLEATVVGEQFIVQFSGKRALDPVFIETKKTWLDLRHLQVTVFRNHQVVSSDIYAVP